MPWVTGGGEVVIPLVPGTHELLVKVFPPPGALGPAIVGDYTVAIQVGCSQCDDGNECTSDTCDATVAMCLQPPVVDGSVCNFGGVPGICAAGTCQDRVWGIPQQIETGVGDAEFPSVAIDAAGNAIAVWRRGGFFPLEIWASRFTPGGGWGAAELLKTQVTGAVGAPQVAVDAAGNAIAIWQQDEGTRTDVWVNHYSPGMGKRGGALQ